MACPCCQRYAPKRRDGAPRPECETQKLLRDTRTQYAGLLAAYHALATLSGKCGPTHDARCLACVQKEAGE